MEKTIQVWLDDQYIEIILPYYADMTEDEYFEVVCEYVYSNLSIDIC